MSIIAPDLAKLEVRLDGLEHFIRHPKALLKKWGVVALQDVAETFRAGGRPKWESLRPNTIAARRKKSGGPLQNDGYLRRSFETEYGARSVTIYSTSPIAIHHEYGTGTHGRKKGRYPITAKRAKMLAIPVSPKTLAGLGGSTPTATGGFIFQPKAGQKSIPKRLRGRVGKVVRPHAKLIFRKQVMHPGVAARPMLPDKRRLIPKLQETAEQLMLQIVAKRFIGKLR